MSSDVPAGAAGARPAASSDPGPGGERGSALGVLLVFLRLGLTSFGGPIAHLGYFHDELVTRRRWLGERAYADVVALCQFLPGPASSQVGMAIGLQRAGALGMLAAWVAFTLPSAILLAALGLAVTTSAHLIDGGWVLGLKAAAVAVVAQAVLSMAASLTPDRRRATIAVLGAVTALLAPTPALQLAVIAAAGLAGLVWLRGVDQGGRGTEAFEVRVPRAVAVACLAAYAALLAASLAASAALAGGPLALFAITYRAGALVFGGGHVVLPLLESQLVPQGIVGHDAFLAGYSAAQAVPGPLFTFAAYLGAVAAEPVHGVAGAAIALVGIFLPGALLVVGTLPFWLRLRRVAAARRVMMGVNAGVVGLLAAALYSPVFTSGIGSPLALAFALIAFVALTRWSAPPWAVVLAAALGGALLL